MRHERGEANGTTYLIRRTKVIICMDQSPYGGSRPYRRCRDVVDNGRGEHDVRSRQYLDRPCRADKLHAVKVVFDRPVPCNPWRK